MIRECTRCHKRQPVEEYYTEWNGEPKAECKSCIRIRNRAAYHRRMGSDEQKECLSCLESKPLAAFNVSWGVCKECRAERRRHRKRLETGENTGPMDGKLSPADLVPCKRCGLRGHLAGDPEKCTRPVWTYGHADGGGAYVGHRLR